MQVAAKTHMDPEGEMNKPVKRKKGLSGHNPRQGSHISVGAPHTGYPPVPQRVHPFPDWLVIAGLCASVVIGILMSGCITRNEVTATDGATVNNYYVSVSRTPLQFSAQEGDGNTATGADQPTPGATTSLTIPLTSK